MLSQNGLAKANLLKLHNNELMHSRRDGALRLSLCTNARSTS